MRGVKRGAFVLFGLAAALQLVPYGRGHENPPVLAEPPWDAPATRAAFMRSCGDCHTNETRWPWYSHVAPVSWLVQRDVEEGREHFNASEWGRGRNDAEEAAELVASGAMPLGNYLRMHPEARLTPTQRTELARALAASFDGRRGRGGREGRAAQEDGEGRQGVTEAR